MELIGPPETCRIIQHRLQVIQRAPGNDSWPKVIKSSGVLRKSVFWIPYWLPGTLSWWRFTVAAALDGVLARRKGPGL